MIFLGYFNLYKKYFYILVVLLLAYLISIFFIKDLLYFVQDHARNTYISRSDSISIRQGQYNIGLRLDFIASILIIIIMILFSKKFKLKLITNEDKIFLNLLLSSIIASIGSSLLASTVWVAPNSRDNSSLSACKSTAMIG